MARLFIALELTEEQKREVGALQEKLQTYMEGVRWVKPQGLHLTLKFLGETDEARLDHIKQAMDESAASIKQFAVVYGQSGVFPSPRKARIIWVGLREGYEAVCDVATGMEKALARCGFEPEKRKFTPHLTIGRARNPLPENIARLYMDREKSFTTAACVIRGATLFESKLSPQGATYLVRYRSAFHSQ